VRAEGGCESDSRPGDAHLISLAYLTKSWHGACASGRRCEVRSGRITERSSKGPLLLACLKSLLPLTGQPAPAPASATQHTPAPHTRHLHTLITRQRYTYNHSWPPATRRALEKHQPNRSRVILLRCCISPQHLGKAAFKPHRSDRVTRVLVLQAFFVRIACRCWESASCKACQPSPLDHTGGFLRARAHRTHLVGGYGFRFVTGDAIEGRHGGRGQPKPAAAASKQQRT
jgi:hypothetical protein